MKPTDLSTLPLLEIPSGTPVAVAEALSSADSATALAARMQNRLDSTPQGVGKAAMRKLYDLSQRAARYLRTRAQAMAARAAIEADREATAQEIKQLLAAKDRARKAHSTAVEQREVTLQKVARLQGQLAAVPMPDGKALADAQEAFDKAMISGTDDSQHKAATALHSAKAAEEVERAEATRHAAPIRILIEAQGRIAEQQQDMIEAAASDLERAGLAVRSAEYRMALVEADVATYQSALAYLAVYTAYENSGKAVQPPHGFDAPSFWFSSGRRALAASNVLTNMGPDGPVLLDGRLMSVLADSANAPDLSLFANAPADL